MAGADDDPDRRANEVEAGWRVVRIPARTYWMDPELFAGRIADGLSAF